MGHLPGVVTEVSPERRYYVKTHTNIDNIDNIDSRENIDSIDNIDNIDSTI